MRINKRIAILLSTVFTISLVGTSGAIKVKAETNGSNTNNSTITASGTPQIATGTPENGGDKTYGDLYYKIVDNSITITGCNKSAVNVVIPSQINGVKVTSIGMNTFFGCDQITSIEISSSVINIDDYIFYNCRNLMSINVNSSNKYFSSDKGILYNKDKSQLIAYPQGWKGVATIADTVTNIDRNAFEGCSRITNINVDFKNQCFSSYNGSLYNKNKTELLVCPEGMVGNVTIADTVTSLGISQFNGCSGITGLNVPASVKNIIIPTGVSGIVVPFSGCEALTSINIDVNNSNYISINGIVYSKDKTKMIVCPPGYNGNVYVPEGVKCIGPWALQGCGKVTSIQLPSTFNSAADQNFLGWYTSFSGCYNNKDISSKLISIEVNENNPDFSSENGILYNKDKTRLIACPIGIKGDFIIPNRVAGIGDSAFYNCYGLTSINIPDSVTSVGEYSFSNCRGLTSISISNKITTIPHCAFCGCEKLTNIKIPSSVTNIGYAAFGECSNLTSVEISKGVTNIGSCAFEHCKGMNRIEIPNNVSNIASDAFYGCSNNLVIYGYKGSVAEQFAKDNNIKFAIGIETSSIAFDNSSITMNKGETKNLTVLYTPSNAQFGKDYILSSSNENVAKVDANGQVVAINAGTATITATTENGLTATCKVTVNTPLAIKDYKVSLQSPQTVGTTLTITTSAEGQGVLNYRFAVFKGTTLIKAIDYNTTNYITWTPTESGTYTLYFKVKDSTGKELVKSINYVVNKVIKIDSFGVDLASPQTIGTTLKLTTTSEGQGVLNYRFAVFKGTTLIKAIDYNTTNYITWTPTEAGTYTLYFKVKDETGREVVKSMNYVVNKVIKINSYGVNLVSPQTIGTTLKLTTAAEGQGILNYRFVVYVGTTLIKVRDYNTSNTATWTPASAGTYTLYFKVKDETGREVVKSMQYVVI